MNTRGAMKTVLVSITPKRKSEDNYHHHVEFQILSKSKRPQPLIALDPTINIFNKNQTQLKTSTTQH